MVDTYEFNDNYTSDEDMYKQTLSDLSSKSGIDSIKTTLNSIKNVGESAIDEINANNILVVIFFLFISIIPPLIKISQRNVFNMYFSCLFHYINYPF